MYNISRPDRYGYLDPYANGTAGRPDRPLFQEWQYFRSDYREFRQIFQREDPFLLYMNELKGDTRIGNLDGLQIRAEAYVTEYFYNNTQKGFCESRIINQTLSLRFVGAEPLVFKPGMPFEAQVAVRYHDQVALTQQQLERSTLRIQVQQRK